MKKLIGQIIKFGAVGFLCFFIDYFIMVGLTELAGVPSLYFQRLLLHHFHGGQLHPERHRSVRRGQRGQ